MGPSTRSMDPPPPHKPPIFLTLPNELLLEIARQIGPSLRTLRALTLTCRALYSFIDPLLYELDAKEQRNCIVGGPSKAIEHAIKVPSIRILKHALAAGASVRNKHSTSGFWLALETRAAIVNGAKLRVQLLDEVIMFMATEGDVDVNERKQCHCRYEHEFGPCGWKPVTYAVVYGMEELAEVLIKKGARVCTGAVLKTVCRRLQWGQRPRKGKECVEPVEMAVRLSGGVNSWGSNYETPLHLLVLLGRDPDETGWMGEVLRLLIGLGASVNAMDILGETPLKKAVVRLMSGNIEYTEKGLTKGTRESLNLVRLFLEHGADASLVREPQGCDRVVSMLREICEDVFKSTGRKVEFLPHDSPKRLLGEDNEALSAYQLSLPRNHDTSCSVWCTSRCRRCGCNSGSPQRYSRH
ncbi:hypothetical protein FQN50_003065 [Emmonsiellopsis sp. PD_5]|nr:hypothetical protein FQN50_003065 [Emmonsiellopsis sp. PD_5]